MIYQCPICANILSITPDNKQLSCDKNHQFDRAKQGYFNLLPVQRKKSKMPGDSKEMISAREAFLAGDYYQPLASTLAEIIHPLVGKNATLLDIGCGEGYYSRVLSEHNSHTHYGIDISKPAVAKAAKKHAQGHYAVASSEYLPLQDESIDLAFKIYAPANDSELARVIKANGYLISVTPAPRHLWQLREFIYDDVRAHQTKDTLFNGFTKISNHHLSYDITPDSVNRLRLLHMTPFAWKANESVTQEIEKANELTIELDFYIGLYQKGCD